MHLLKIVLTQVSLRSQPRLTWAETFSERLVSLYQNITGFHDHEKDGNIVGLKKDNAGNIFPQCFLPCQKQIVVFV